MKRRFPHGTENGYVNLGCRCRRCKNAHATAVAISMENRRHRLGPCTVEGCERGQYSRGLCKNHYERQRTGRPMDTPVVPRPRAYGRIMPGKRR